MKLTTKTSTAALGCLAALSVTLANAASPTLPFPSGFPPQGAKADWVERLDRSNSIVVAGEVVQVRARAGTHARVEHGLETDVFRVSCALLCDSISAPAMVSLRWDNPDFIEIGLNATTTGQLSVREVLGTYPHDYAIAPVASGKWQYVEIELARDCVRYRTSIDGRGFKTVLVRPRPERLASKPKLVIVGQDAPGKVFARPNPWTVPPETNVYHTVSFRDFRVEPLPRSAATATAGERRHMAAAERDAAGEAELAKADDPTFESVSRHFPAMKWSREVTGVKDHPLAIGIAPDGALQLTDNIAAYHQPGAHLQIDDYRFGSGTETCVKRLQDGWMPIVSTLDTHADLSLEETVFGWSEGFSPDKELMGFVSLRITNNSTSRRAVEASLVFDGSEPSSGPLNWHLDLAPGESQRVSARVPRKTASSQTPAKIDAGEFQEKLQETDRYWNGLIAQGSRFEIPEARVRNAYRAWLAYNFLNLARRNGVDEVCDGSGFYGKVYGYSAALYCHALDLMGYHDMAAHYCEALLSFAHTNGLLAVNFGDTDTGTALWVMAEHYRLTRDDAWLRRMAPQMRRMCAWIINQRHEALARAAGEPAVARGLIRYQPYADLLHAAADYFSNGYLWKGLDATAGVFAEIGLTEEAENYRREADAYRHDLEASMDAAVFTDRGQEILPMIPDSHELWKESDGSADGYYGIIAPCLLDIGLPSWPDRKAKIITDALEQRGGLVCGITQFHRMADHAYTYGYWLDCLQRGQPKRAILGLYGSLAYGMSRDTFAAVECTMVRTGENYWMLPHTYSDTQQLRLLRDLLVREDGDTLRLAQGVPRPWLAPGQRVAVHEAPTEFGPVSYSIEPLADGTARVRLTPPTRNPPHTIVLTLRDFKHRRIASVTGAAGSKVRHSGEEIELTDAVPPLDLQVKFR